MTSASGLCERSPAFVPATDTRAVVKGRRSVKEIRTRGEPLRDLPGGPGMEGPGTAALPDSDRVSAAPAKYRDFTPYLRQVNLDTSEAGSFAEFLDHGCTNRHQCFLFEYLL